MSHDLGRLRNHFGKPFSPDGFVQELGDPHPGAGFLDVGHDVRRHSDDCGLFASGALHLVCLDAPRGFQPVHHRHVQVHEHHVVRVLLEGCQPLGAVVRQLDLGVAQRHQHFAEDALVDGVVLTHQDARRVGLLSGVSLFSAGPLDQVAGRLRGQQGDEQVRDLLHRHRLGNLQGLALVEQPLPSPRHAADRLGGGPACDARGRRMVAEAGEFRVRHDCVREVVHVGHRRRAPAVQQSDGEAVPEVEPRAPRGSLRPAQHRLPALDPGLGHRRGPVHDDQAHVPSSSSQNALNLLGPAPLGLLDTQALQQLHHSEPHHLRVADHEDAHSLELSPHFGRCVGGSHVAQAVHLQPLHRDVELEHAPLPHFAFQPYPPSRALHDDFADGQPQPGAARVPCQRAVHLLKGQEDLLHVLRRDPSPRVLHLEMQHGVLAHLRRVAARAPQRHPDADGAAVRELDGVGAQVDEHLSQPHDVPPPHFRHVRLQVVPEVEPLLVGDDAHRLHHFLDALPDVDGLRLLLPVLHRRRRRRLHFGEVQHLVQQRDHLLGAAAHHGHQLVLLVGQLLLRQQHRTGVDGVHGRPQLVADVGQELRLGARRVLGDLPRLGHLQLGVLLRRAVLQVHQPQRVLGLGPAAAAAAAADVQLRDALQGHAGPDLPSPVARHVPLHGRVGGARQLGPQPVRRDGLGLLRAEEGQERRAEGLVEGPPGDGGPARAGHHDGQAGVRGAHHAQRVAAALELQLLQVHRHELVHVVGARPGGRHLVAVALALPRGERPQAGGQPRLQVVPGQARQRVEHRLVVRRELLPGLDVDDAQRAQRQPLALVLHHQRHPGVEPDVRPAPHQRVLREARVLPGVQHHEHVVGVEDGVPAEGHLARGLGGLQARLGQEPLPVLVHQRHQRNRHVEHRRAHVGEPLELLRVGLVQHAEGHEAREALRLVGRRRRGHVPPPPPAPPPPPPACSSPPPARSPPRTAPAPGPGRRASGSPARGRPAPPATPPSPARTARRSCPCAGRSTGPTSRRAAGRPRLAGAPGGSPGGPWAGSRARCSCSPCRRPQPLRRGPGSPTGPPGRRP
mmetsp:Transcript_4728/g.13255  ORF Transcript_4728/g.13255 Transcript_4728/m.13255 type:complete len:1072 (+) Transcript_4728:81-3296(+)